MINLLIGASGSGKSYEANVFHILHWLGKGRLVITNLPVDVEAYAAIDPAYRDLLEVRKKAMPIRGQWTPTREEGAFCLDPEGMLEEPPVGARPFAGVWDYYSEWRHPVHGFGALFVIDEAQYPLPKADTSVEVEEWFALHRHFNADALLLTQSYGRLSEAVRGNVQLVYRCRKNVALGSTTSYTRKVQDGLRGEVVNTTIRKYEPKHFKLYRSHTQGGAAEEFNASDVRPLWKHWSFIGSAVMLALFACIAVGCDLRMPWKAKPPKQQQTKGPDLLALVKKPEAAATPASSPAAAPPGDLKAAAVVDPAPEPFARMGVHLTGKLGDGQRVVWTFRLSQNGQAGASITDAELRDAGYTWQGQSICSGVLAYGSNRRAVTCDAPQVSLGGGVSAGS